MDVVRGPFVRSFVVIAVIDSGRSAQQMNDLLVVRELVDKMLLKTTPSGKPVPHVDDTYERHFKRISSRSKGGFGRAFKELLFCNPENGFRGYGNRQNLAPYGLVRPSFGSDGVVRENVLLLIDGLVCEIKELRQRIVRRAVRKTQYVFRRRKLRWYSRAHAHWKQMTAPKKAAETVVVEETK